MSDLNTDLTCFSLTLCILFVVGIFVLPLWALLVVFGLMVIVCFIDLAALLALFLDRR